jgi:dimethylaniline monooxygenase (N-oxide forming)
MTPPELPSVAVIGAGSSGIAAVKALDEQGFGVVAFEASDRVGGNWVYGNRNGMSSAYRSLHINTSRLRMAYSDFPMPADYPDFPRHDQVAAYFDAYVERFGFRERIRFETAVEHAAREDDGTWRLTLAGGGEARFDALLVANGHHWDPRWPEPPFPGQDEFAGEQIHAHDYKHEDQLRGRRVVVVGMGNSAMDIAVDASYHAEEVHLAARRGAWIVPKYLGGRPADGEHPVLTNPRVPFRVRQVVAAMAVKRAVGRMEDYGLPAPDHEFGEAHPTVSGRILDRIAHGAIRPHPNVARLERDRVVFADGSSAAADLVVYCTGYKITFPFFDEDFVSAPDNRIELFWRVFRPDVANLAFVGLLQPLGAIMPLAEAQGRWIADYLAGRYRLPPAAEMREWIARDREALRRRYVASKRHTIQVDFDDYLHGLAKERRRGAERARAAGHALPVPPRAGRGVGAAR